MKKLLTILLIGSTALLLIAVVSFSQQKPVKDTTAVPDSVAIVSVNDMVSALKYLEDKVTKKEYDQFERAYILLLQVTDDNRKKKLSQPKK